MESFSLGSQEFIELHKLLKRVGFFDTGGMAKQAISEGQILVNGQVETRKGYKIRKGFSVEWNGQKITVS